MLKLKTMQGKFTSYTIILLTIPPIIFLICYYSVFKNKIISDAYEDIQDIAIYRQTAINGWIEHHESLLALVASAPKFIREPVPLRMFFQAFLDSHTDFRSIVFFDQNGNFKISAPDLPPANISDREYFARAREGISTTTSPLISRLSGEQVVIVAHPVQDNNGNFNGVIVGAIKFEKFLDEFSLSETDSTSRPYLVEAKNNTLLSGRQQNKKAVIIPPKTDGDLPQSYINSNGMSVIGVFAPVNNDNWLIIVEKPFNHILQGIELFLLVFAAASLVSLIVLVPLIKNYISALIKPIETISYISTELMNDQTNAACPYIDMKNSPNEIFNLYHNFCNMAEKISAYLVELTQRSLTDPLTGLSNRRCLETEGYKIIEVCRRNSTACTCLVLDLDHFKHVNDTFGHQAGDAALQAVSAVIKRNTRASDICARFGGEEFTILLTSTTIDRAIILAERIRSEIEDTQITYNEFSFYLTVSIGIAQLNIIDNTSRYALDEGIKNADEAMYKAKNNGRNRVEIWDDASKDHNSPSLT